MSFDATLDLAPRPSVRALRLLFFLHALPLALAMPVLGGGVRLVAFAVAVLGSWLWTRRHPAIGFGPRALTRLTWHADGHWALHDASGTAQEAVLAGESVVSGPALVLNFQTARGRRTRILLGDELPEPQLRRLRARLLAARENRP
ncbi:MAG TPA: protein YgfX [Candidatus Binatia bacterium]|nr:protein YgfX [Candidatus Binatia bacterium]